MNTINCRIKLNDHADVAGVSITPAEVIILRKLHDHHAGGNCIIAPVAAGKAMVFVPPAEEGGKAEVRERTDAEEYMRLRKKYPQRESPDKPNSSFIDPLFPGISTGTGRLPASFNELPPQYAIGAIGLAVEPMVRTQDKSEPVAVSEAQAAELMAEATKVETPVQQEADALPASPDDEKADLSGPVETAPRTRRSKRTLVEA